MSRLFRLVVSVLIVLFGSVNAFAQQDSTVAWRLSLQDLEHRLTSLSEADAAGIEAWRADAEGLRSSLVLFVSTHAGVQIATPGPLPEKSGLPALEAQLDKLSAAVNEGIRQSPNSPFRLGDITVAVSAPASTPSLVTDRIDHTDIEQHDFLNIAKAFDYLPGVEIQHIANNRNEAGIMVRGFATRGQIPFYLDGIPISVPYDGFVDFNRFLTGGLATLQVDKGYASPLLGPNALGGAINLVTSEPGKKIEGEALLGAGSGGTVPTSLSVGSRWTHFFLQGSVDRVKVDNVPLSGNFQVLQYANIPHVTMTDQLNHSATEDDRTIGRFGWTPRAGDEYVVTYTNQHGEKGVPLYQGPNTAATFRNFWSWPYWDMDNVSFHSVTQLSPVSSIKFRAFYNQFKNAIDMFSNDTYTVMNTSSAEHSAYDEHTDGASAEFSTRIASRQTFSASLFLKNDVHTEIGTYPGRTPFPLVTPTLVDRDQQTSIGLQDEITLSRRLTAVFGFSADHFNGQQGEGYNAALTALAPFTCVSSPTNTSIVGCTLHAWNYNPQASLSYRVVPSGNLFVTFADRGRFPILKDIYSASLGAGLPNPDLQPEHSRNWNVGYSQTLPARTSVQVDVFRSDLRDAIESVFVTDPGGTSAATAYCPTSKIVGYCSLMANIGSEVHDGVEMKVRSTPTPRVTFDTSYSYLHRTLTYDFSAVPTVSQVNTSIVVLPTLPKNKFVGTASIEFPHRILGLVSERYESGLLLQDTTYATTSPLFLPFQESFAVTDLSAVVPLAKGVSAQAGVKNAFDKNYFYTAGYPEEGRNWYFNLRWQF